MFLFGKQLSKKKVSQYETLSAKWTGRHKTLQEKLWARHGQSLKNLAKSSKNFAAGSLAGLVMLASPGVGVTSTPAQTVKEKPFKDLDKTSSFLLELNSYVPKQVRPLSPDEETKIGKILSDNFGLQASAELDGIRLNRSYGYIGQEQHLARFPGDTMDTHFASGDDAQKFYEYGMAPGLGAYGYFAKSQNMTEEESMREKYYIAVQTFLAPNYLENTKKMNEFFQFHKMLVVNPDNGKALVADIGDAGPAEWTGKSLGGSPEVMRYLERVDGAGKGAVLYFFINDPKDTVPLGPVSL